jgi:hypothetical protein
LPDDLAILPAGLDLATALADVDRSSLSDKDLIRLAHARQRLAAHVQAQLLADLHAIGQRADPQMCTTELERQDWAETEIAMAMTWTRTRAGAQLCLADDLMDRLPAVFAALDAGEIDVPKAMVFGDETSNLDQDVARRVADQVLGQAHRLTTGQLRAKLQKAATHCMATTRSAGRCNDLMHDGQPLTRTTTPTAPATRSRSSAFSTASGKPILHQLATLQAYRPLRRQRRRHGVDDRAAEGRASYGHRQQQGDEGCQRGTPQVTGHIVGP